MRAFLLAFFLFFLNFSCFPQDSESNNSKSIDSKSKKINSSIVEIPAGENSLFTCVYYFDSMEDGAKIAEEKFGIKNFSRFEKISFTKLRRIAPGDKISAYEFGMFKSENEFWILKNAGDGWLWGKGFFLPK